MSKLLLLHGFNNYYNRIRQPQPNIGYKAAVGEGNWREFPGINFFPNDYVTTTQTINFSDSGDLGFDPDYLVVLDDESTDENIIVKSRWFVLEAKQNRKKQLNLQLRRDLLIDYAEEIDESTAYIEKGVVPFSSGDSSVVDPAFYLEEDISFNECPVSQKYLKQPDVTGYYIILYVACDGRQHEVKVQDPNDPETEANWLVFPSDRTPSANADYCIYYIPYGATAAFKAAGIFARSLSGSGALYDIQLMPYKPDNDSAGNLQTAGVYGLPQLTIYKASNAWLGFPVSFTRSELGLHAVNSAKAAKVANQCEKIRIYSPGQANAFEYTPFKANAYKTLGYTFTVIVTFKPVNPYIFVRPNLRGLYNNPNVANPTDFDKDPRGLVVGTDYGLPIITDQWLTYEANNKNYLNSFNRDVDSVEFNNNINLAKDIISAGANTISTALNPFTANQALMSGIGGAADVLINQAQRAEALDLTKDQFNYSMKNIQAKPSLLNRVSSFVMDSQMYPYIMAYSCSSTEISAFEAKLKWNGMKINRIGKIGTYRGYLNSNADFLYMKCKLIRFSVNKEDHHIVSEIASELDKGFFRA